MAAAKDLGQLPRVLSWRCLTTASPMADAVLSVRALYGESRSSFVTATPKSC
jgi:hypothetical protein